VAFTALLTSCCNDAGSRSINDRQLARTITAGSEEATPTALSKIESNVAPRLRLRSADRLIFVWLYRLYPSLLEAAVVFKPETLVRWHRSGSRLYWRCKSRRRVGRPAVPADIRDLIRTISRDNPLWGAPRIHGELLKLGIDIAQSTVAKYMSRRHGPRSPGWQTFLRNHTAHIAGIDLFVVPTVGFKLLLRSAHRQPI